MMEGILIRKADLAPWYNGIEWLTFPRVKAARAEALSSGQKIRLMDRGSCHGAPPPTGGWSPKEAYSLSGGMERERRGAYLGRNWAAMEGL